MHVYAVGLNMSVWSQWQFYNVVSAIASDRWIYDHGLNWAHLDQ